MGSLPGLIRNHSKVLYVESPGCYQMWTSSRERGKKQIPDDSHQGEGVKTDRESSATGVASMG